MKTDDIRDPQHYAGKYPFEVFQAIELLLNTFGGDLPPYQAYQLGNELKYRLRAGWKDDGEGGVKDLRKAIRCNEMRDEAVLRDQKKVVVSEDEADGRIRRTQDAVAETQKAYQPKTPYAGDPSVAWPPSSSYPDLEILQRCHEATSTAIKAVEAMSLTKETVA